MKKYLMSLAAIALVGSAFVSCSNDDMANPSQADVDQAKYEAAFLAYVGGKIAPNQDWGFSTTRSKFTRSINSNWDGWASAPANSDFATEVEGVEYSASEYGQGTEVKKFYLPETTATQDFDAYNGNFILYVSGTKSVNFTNPADAADHMLFYVLPGANLTFTNYFTLQKPQDFKMYIAEGATVTFAAGMNSNIQMYNRGEVIVRGSEQCGVYGHGIIYNEGTMTFESTSVQYDQSIAPYGQNVSGALVIHNAESQIVNVGTITTKGLRVEGSGHFKNETGGEMNVNGYTILNSNDCSWINNGVYNTTNFRYTAGSTDVINNCRLNVSELFFMDLKDCTEETCFLMDGGSGVVTKNYLAQAPGYIRMGSNSVFKVTETATMNHTKANYGIYGEGDDYAVFQAKNIVAGTANQGFLVTYGGKLAVVAESHFAQGNDGEVTHPFIDIKGDATIYAPDFNDGLPAITIAETPCNPGFKGGDEELYDLRIIAEDLSASQASDFDFNDIVIDIKFGAPAKLRLMAAGGTLPLRINESNDLEVHKLFGEWLPGYQLGMGDKTEQNPTPTLLPMINTGAGPEKDPVVLTTAQFSGTILSPEAANGLKIEVYKNGSWQELTATQGKAACKLAVKPSFHWQKEYTSIKASYPLFLEWCAEGPDVVWY